MGKLEFVASVNVFRTENQQHNEIKWVETEKEWVTMGAKYFIALGVFYQPTKFQLSTLQIGQDSSIYILEIK